MLNLKQYAQHYNDIADALLNGVDYSRYPSPRIYTVGVNVQF